MGRTARRGGWRLRRQAGSPYWFVRWSSAGRRYERSTGQTEAGRARREAAQIYAEAQARAEAAGDTGRHALREAVAGWLIDVEAARSPEWHDTLKVYWRAHWQPRWVWLEELTSEAVQTYIRERLELVEAASLAKELSALRQLLKWCKRRGVLAEVPEWTAPTPSTDFEAPVLTRAQVARILAKLPDRHEHPKGYPVREYFTLAYWCAFRRGTLARVEVRDVDLPGRRLRVRPSSDKRRAGRWVPLPRPAAEMLEDYLPEDEDRVGLLFGTLDLRASLAEAVKAARVKVKVTGHTFRHSRLTHLADEGATITELKQISGHRTLASLQRYLRSSERAAQALIERLGE